MGSPYKDLEFDLEVTQMFAHLVKSDDALWKVLKFIGVSQMKHSGLQDDRLQDNDEVSSYLGSITIKDLCENVTLQKRVRVKNKASTTYEITKGTIDRKLAERTVNTLEKMSLIEAKRLTPHKFLRLTIRGQQVLNCIVTWIKEEKANGSKA